jgi:AcrR family transcriptional regulator
MSSAQNEHFMSEKRPTLRQRQAQDTRALVVAAARALFLERGYTNTTIESIADRACVAVSTVYSIFGSKRGLLRQIREEWHLQTHIREFLSTVDPQEEPGILLDRFALATGLQWQMGAEVIAIYRGAAAADREAAAELTAALEGRRKALDAVARRLAPNLRPGLDIQRASAILRALCQAELYEELVGRSGWTVEAYQTWLAAGLKCQLLGDC